MLKSHVYSSLRNLNKHRLFTTINIVGLAISMSTGILMVLVLSELYSFDNFHDKKDKIYRVTTSLNTLLEEKRDYATSSMYIGRQVKDQLSGIESVVIMRRIEKVDIEYNHRALSTSGFYASSSFFDTFSFELVRGNPQTALADPNTIVLTESTSKRIFGDKNPIGQIVTIEGDKDDEICTITGVVKDPPTNSHLQFEMLVSLETFTKQAINVDHDFINDPGEIFFSYVYLVLDNIRKEEVENSISQIMRDYNSHTEAPITHLLQPLSSIVTGDFYHNAPGPSFPKSKLFTLIILTLVVLISACFNYTNLSLARSLRRSKEVGIRRLFGANSQSVFFQFIIEAIIVSVMALVLGIALFFFIKPGFLNLPNPTAKGYQMFSLDISSIQVLYFFILATIVGCIAGLLPAIIHARLKARVAIIDASKLQIFSGIRLRQILVIFQLIISIGLIMCAVIVYKQYKFTVNYDLGYSTENIVNVKIKGDYLEILENQYAKLPEVLQTSSCSVILGVGDGSIGTAQSEDKSHGIRCLFNSVDQNYLSMHEYELIAGSDYLPRLHDGDAPKYLVVNEQFLSLLNIGPPQEAVGKTVWFNNSRLTIQGVVTDFISISLNKQFNGAFAFIQTNHKNENQFLSVKVLGDNVPAVLAKLDEMYKRVDPIHAFEASFYNDRIAETYKQQNATFTIVTFLSIVAISISTLGLLGMLVYAVETRIKEFSIRKVLGASFINLAFNLFRGLLVMLLVAGAFAIPVTLYIVNHRILNEFIYRAVVGPVEILSGFYIVLMVGMLTAVWQIVSVTRKNLCHILRNE